MKQTIIILLCFFSMAGYAQPNANKLSSSLIANGKTWMLQGSSAAVCSSYRFSGGGSVQSGGCPAGVGGSNWSISQSGGKSLITIGNKTYELQMIQNNGGEINMILRGTTLNYQGKYPEYTFK